MKWKISEDKKKSIKRYYVITLLVTGVIVVLFNDYFGKQEGFLEFIALYFILLFISVAYWVFKQIKSIIRLKHEKEKTEIMHLKSQVNPHFFFNMLNNLYGLVDEDSKKAQALILKLSDMMRYSIYEGDKDTVLLSEEISYLENYIELHKMRYHKTIDVQFHKDTNNTDYEIMPLLFIILLENAFKHGVENLSTNAYVHIHLKAHNNQVFFEIENNFDAIDTEQQVAGIGLQNLKRRLALVYPKKHNLSLFNNNGIYTAKLNIKL
ncbi:histidine kinase [Polaribacter reichenbachii]|uniref:Histidine kinase n=1 Tax=Polaribacter reichenbachii TaxID=996801 RepID=A0A1B8U1F0_9FLAO|nr:histidine kinase [Polaribacter reichenbachii]APZ47342.1 histidine kinase [Polaribacter reichenbachii]AUC17983.1 histidine kinase [Polaribacter reichenbachii]OBY65690.1 histidine kinase [Polaribacter reichenbachii]